MNFKEGENPNFSNDSEIDDKYRINSEIKERSSENGFLITKGVDVLRGIRTRINEEKDPKYFIAAYEQGLQIAQTILADFDIDVGSADRTRLEQIIVENYREFVNNRDYPVSTYKIPSYMVTHELYGLAMKLKTQVEKIIDNQELDQKARIHLASQDYFLDVNQLGEDDLQKISSRWSRFVSPLSGGLVATLLWKLVMEKITNKSFQPKVLAASADSNKGRAYFQVDASIISEDQILYVYILDDINFTGKTRNIITTAAKKEYPKAKIYSGIDPHELNNQSFNYLR